MSAVRVSAGLCLAALVLGGAACSDKDKRPDALAPGAGGTGGGAAGTSAGEAGAAGYAGAAGDNTGGASGTAEACADGVDNDFDGDVDCYDADCAEHCKTSCPMPIVLPDGSIIRGDTTGHAQEVDVSCASPNGASGPEVVYQVTALHAGRLRVSLNDTVANMIVEIRRSCAAEDSVIACKAAFASVPVAQDEVLYVIVDGVEAKDSGPYTLSVASGPVECGDAFLDDAEECDDGARAAGDGCSEQCTVESRESAANDTPETADAFTPPRYFGTISPAGDVDVVSVTVARQGSTILARTDDFGDAGCQLGLMDTEVDLIASDQSTVLASNDDKLPGYRCSEVEVPNLAPGTYYVRVRAAASGAISTFGYGLDVIVLE